MTHAQETPPAPARPQVTVNKPVYMPLVGCGVVKTDKPKEVRALWISRFDLGSPPSKQARLEELLMHPSTSAKLGIYRIAHEGRFDIDCTYVNEVVTVTATRSLP